MSESKGMGIPRGLFFYRYRPFITAFADSIDMDIKVSAKTNQQLVKAGVCKCHERSCTAGKIFNGHCTDLEERGYTVFVPKSLRTEFGSDVCASSLLEKPAEEVLFQDELWDAVKRRDATKRSFDRAFANGVHAQKYTVRGYNDQGYRYKVLLAGRPYTIYDNYVNMEIKARLNKLDIGVITIERMSTQDERTIDGILYLSSFGCQRDEGWVSYLKGRFFSVPFTLIQTGEHLHAAALNLRLEAFKLVLEGRRRRSR